MTSPAESSTPYTFHFRRTTPIRPVVNTATHSAPSDMPSPPTTFKYHSDQENFPTELKAHNFPRRNSQQPLSPHNLNAYSFKALTPRPKQKGESSPEQLENVEESNLQKREQEKSLWALEKKELTQKVKKLKMLVAQLRKESEQQKRTIKDKEDSITSLRDRLGDDMPRTQTLRILSQTHSHTFIPKRVEQKVEKVQLLSFEKEYHYVLNYFNISMNDSHCFQRLKRALLRLRHPEEKEWQVRLQQSREKEAKLSHMMKKMEQEYVLLSQSNEFLRCDLEKHILLLEQTTEELQMVRMQYLNSKYKYA